MAKRETYPHELVSVHVVQPLPGLTAGTRYCEQHVQPPSRRSVGASEAMLHVCVAMLWPTRIIEDTVRGVGSVIVCNSMSERFGPFTW